MSSRKSSITAEVKVAGLAKFKSDLGGVGTAAKKAGKEISSIRPPDLAMTPVYQYWEARKRGERMLTAAIKTEADKRAKIIRESSMPLSGSRSQPGMMAGGGGGGGNGRGIGSAYGLSVGYNFAQDLAQGGIAGVANNIPQVIELVGNSPKLKSLLVAGAGVASAAISSALAVFSYKKNVYDVSGQGFVNEVDRRQIAAQALSRSAQYRRENAATIAGAETRGASVATSYQEAGLKARKEADTAANLASREEAIVEAKFRVAMASAESIQDEIIRNETIAKLERERIEEVYQAKLKSIEKEDAIIRNEYYTAAEKAAALQKGFNAKPAGILTPEESADYRVLEIGLEAARVREEEGKQLLAQINLAKENHLATRQIIDAEKELISIRERANLTTISAAWSAEREAEHEKKIEDDRKKEEEQIASKEKRFQEDQQKAENQIDFDQRERDLADWTKANQQKRDDEVKALEEEEAIAKMSPRKLEKYQKEQSRMKEEKRLVEEVGLSPEQAKEMAKRRENLQTPRNGRIRGAGFKGSKDERYTGVENAGFNDVATLNAERLDAMVKPPSPRTIKGAGAKEPKQKDDGAKPSTGVGGDIAKLIAATERVEKAVLSIGPSSNDRAKPLSTSTR